MEKMPVLSKEDFIQEAFEDYRDKLRLRSEDLKRKTLDIGSAEGGFSEYLRVHDINQNVFNLDLNDEFYSREKSVQGSGTKENYLGND